MLSVDSTFLEIHKRIQSKNNVERNRLLFVYKVIKLWNTFYQYPPTLLDLGSGNGIMSGSMALMASKVIGVDQQEEEIRKANSCFGSRTCH